MQTTTRLLVWLVLWGAVIAVLVGVRWRKRIGIGSGILLGYLLHLATLHWVSALLYALPWYRNYKDPFTFDWVVTGFEQSGYGILAFTVGSLLIAPLVEQVWGGREVGAASFQPYWRLPEVYMTLGAVSYGILALLLGQVPTLSAIVSMSQHLFVVGLCLACWRAWQMRSRTGLMKWFGIALTLPFITILTRGFMGYGAVAVLVVGVFIASFFRPRWKVVAVGLLLGYLGTSLYLSYMRDRTQIREVVWGGRSYGERFQQLWTTLETMEWFDPYNVDHLNRIDRRLNQNLFVGIAAYRLAESKDFAHGETFFDALLALVPRALWPDKPVRAGSPGLVSRFTGLQFAEGTSVGIGHVMEFYVNFGTLGVWAGFLVLGTLITIVDKVARRRLEEGDWQGFTLWFLVGISFLQVGGSLVELAGSAGASVAAAMLVNRHLLRGFQRRLDVRPRGRIEGALRGGR